MISSVSIACWIVVFTPQIVENFRRHSADGLSLLFLIVWLLGDVFNIIGAVLQGVLPTMTILAVYYTFADIVLLGQCFYYRGWRLSDLLKEGNTDGAVKDEEDDEERPLLMREDPPTPTRPTAHLTPADADRRRPSNSSLGSFHEHLRSANAARLSPAMPIIPKKATDIPNSLSPKKDSILLACVYNTTALIVVCAAGALGWWLTARGLHSQSSHDSESSTTDTPVHFDVLGQFFGYLCAVLYLGSRIPQLLLNWQRKSTEGVSMLFFLFACVGNLTYVLSIFAYEPRCARLATFGDKGGCGKGDWRREYGRYILLNASWLIGSAGTLLLDLMIFGQFWIYRGRKAEDVE